MLLRHFNFSFAPHIPSSFAIDEKQDNVETEAARLQPMLGSNAHLVLQSVLKYIDTAQSPFL
jgi:hypothetical protein